jgi:hypothetical protein
MPTEVRSSPTRSVRQRKAKSGGSKEAGMQEAEGCKTHRREEEGEKNEETDAGRVSCYIGYFQRSLKLCLGQVLPHLAGGNDDHRLA